MRLYNVEVIKITGEHDFEKVYANDVEHAESIAGRNPLNADVKVIGEWRAKDN